MESVVTGKVARVVDCKSTPVAAHVDLELQSMRALAPLVALKTQAREAWQRRAPERGGDFEAAFEAACVAEDFFYGLPQAPSLHIPLRIHPLDSMGPARRDLTSLLRDQSCPLGVVIVAPGGAGKTITARKAYFDCLRGPVSRRALKHATPQARAVSVRLQPPALGGYLPIWLDLSQCAGVVGPAPGSADFISALIAKAQGVEQLPLAGVKRWLDSGPRVMLFAELDEAPAAARAGLAAALGAWQEVYTGSGHSTVVTLRPPSGNDKTLATLRGSAAFGIFSLGLPAADELLAYFRHARELEVRVFSSLGLPRPERDFLTEYMNLERIVARQISAGESLVLTPLLMYWLSLLRGASLSGVETLSDIHRKVVESLVASELPRPGDDASAADRCDRIERAILGLGRLALAMQAEARRGGRLSLELGRDVLTDPAPSLRKILEPAGDTANADEWLAFPCWSQALSAQEAEDLLASSLVARHGGVLDFSIGSLRAYFIGAVALSPAGDRGNWASRILALLRQDSSSWEIPARYLGGAMTVTQLEELATAFFLADPDSCLPRLLSALLRGRPKTSASAHTLDAIEDTLTKRSFLLGNRPDLLLQECHNGLHWYEVERASCRELAQKMRRDAGERRKGWLRLLSNPFTSSTCVMPEHKRPVVGVAVLPDGRVASGGEDQLVKIWDHKLGKVRTMDEHRGPITALLVAPDGRVVSASQDRTIKLWDVRSGGVTTLRDDMKAAEVLALHVRGGLLSGGQDNAVRLWDLRTGQSRVLIQHADQVRALAVMPGGQVLSGGADGHVKLWDPASNTVTTILEHQGAVRALAVLADGRVLSGSEDRTIRMWDSVRGGAQVLTGHTGAITALAVRPDNCFVSASSDRTVRLWSPRTGGVETLADHTGEVTAIAFHPDGKVISASEDYTVRLWDPARSQVKVMKDHRDRVRALAVSGDGRIVSGSNDGTVRIWDPSTRAAGGSTEALAPIQTVVALQDGHVVSGGSDGAIRLWDPRRGEPVVVARHNGWVTCLAAFPDGSLASGGADNIVKLWESRGSRVSTMDFHSQKIWAVAIFPGGLIASSSLDGSVKLWDPSSGAVKSMSEHQGQVWPIAVLPGGRIASGGTDKTVRLWDPLSGEVKTLGAHGGWVWALAPLPDGKLASCGADCCVRIWDLATGNSWVMEEHTDLVRFLGALPDGRVASAGFDGKVKVWDAKSGQIDTMSQHTAPILGLSVLADGRIATASEDGTIKLWNSRTGDVLTHVTDQSPTSLSCPPGLPCIAAGFSDGSISLLAVEPEATMARSKR